jgi:hypothetical protein
MVFWDKTLCSLAETCRQHYDRTHGPCLQDNTSEDGRSIFLRDAGNSPPSRSLGATLRGPRTL